MEAELSADRNTMALGYKVGGLHKGSTEQHNTEQYCGVVRGARALGWHSRLSAASCGVLPVVVQGLRVREDRRACMLRYPSSLLVVYSPGYTRCSHIFNA